MNSGRWNVLASAVLLVAAIACDGGGNAGGTDGTDGDIGPADEDDYAQALAEAICGPQFACGCGDLSYANEQQCVDERKAILEMRAAAAQAEGLTYDESCSEIELNYYADLGCAPDTKDIACVVCNAYHGDLEEDAACESGQSGYTPCAQGLECRDGVCTNPCQETEIVGQGGTCDFETKVCDPDADLYCDGMTLTCLAAPKVGEPCVNLFCGNEAWCNGEDPGGPICMPLRALDELCQADRQCESKSCDLDTGRCVPTTPLVCVQ